LFDIDRICAGYIVRDNAGFTRDHLLQCFNVMALANQLFHVNIYNNPYLANQFLTMAGVAIDITKLMYYKKTQREKSLPLPLV